MKYIIIAVLIAFLLLICIPSCSDDDPINEPMYFTELNSDFINSSTLNSDTINLGGAPLLIPAYAELYATATIVTVLPVANTFYLVTGNTASQEILGFTSNGLGRLTYTDITPDRVALVTAAISFTARDAGTYTFQMYKSGVGDLASRASDSITVVDSIDNIAMISLITLQPDDYMDIYLSCNETNAIVGFLTMSFAVTTVD